MNLPPQIDEDAGRDKVRTLVRGLRDYLASLNLGETPGESSPFIVETTPANWSNTTKASEFTYGETRPVEGSPTLTDVYDGAGFQRMTKEYYEKNWAPKKQVEAVEAEIEGNE